MGSLSLYEAQLAAGTRLEGCGQVHGFRGFGGFGGLGKGQGAAIAAATAAEQTALADIEQAEARIKRAIDNMRSVSSRLREQAITASTSDPQGAASLENVARRLQASIDEAEQTYRSTKNGAEAIRAREAGKFWAQLGPGASFVAAAGKIEALARDSESAESEARTIGMRLERTRETQSATLRAEELRIAEARRQDDERRAREATDYQARQAADERRYQAEIQREAQMRAAEQAAREEERLARTAEKEATLAAQRDERESRRMELEQARQREEGIAQREAERESRLMEQEMARLEKEEERLARQEEREEAQRMLQIQLQMMEKGLIPSPAQMMQQQAQQQQYGPPMPGGAYGPGPATDSMGPYPFTFPGAPPPVVQPGGGGGGLDFSPFSPGGELFGMGGMGAMVDGRAVNPNLPPGSQVEAGYRVDGPSQGMFTVTTPDGRRFGMSVEQIAKPDNIVGDPGTGTPVYTSPPSSSSAVDFATNVRALTEGFMPAITGAADAYARATGRAPAPPPPPAPTRPSSGPSTVTVVIGVGAAAAIAYAIYKAQQARRVSNPARRRRNPRRNPRRRAR